MENLESELEMSEITSDELFNLSKESFKDIWGGAENDHWDDFFKKPKNQHLKPPKMKNIFLIGMPSSGKSTLGRQLAKRLDYQFIDMDDLIVNQELSSVFDIFKYKGEDYFRKVESKVLRGIKPNQKLIVATGGGVPCFFDNMDFIKANGISIFLNVQPEDLLKRIQKSEGNNRPLIDKKKSNEVLLNELKERYENRLKFYEQADIQIDGSIEVEQILWLLEEIE
jgi:shikimate kinase